MAPGSAARQNPEGAHGVVAEAGDQASTSGITTASAMVITGQWIMVRYDQTSAVRLAPGPAACCTVRSLTVTMGDEGTSGIDLTWAFVTDRSIATPAPTGRCG
jgi:hypothetical protein